MTQNSNCSAAKAGCMSIIVNAQSQEEMTKQLSSLLSILGKTLYPGEHEEVETAAAQRSLDFERMRHLGERVLSEKFASLKEAARAQKAA